MQDRTSHLGRGRDDVSPCLHSLERWRAEETAPTRHSVRKHNMQNESGGTFGVCGKLRSGVGELVGFPLWAFASQSSAGWPGSPARKEWLPRASSRAEGSGRVGVRSCVGMDGGGGMGIGGGVRCTQGEDEALMWPDEGSTGGAGTLEGGLMDGGWGITGNAEGVLGG